MYCGAIIQLTEGHIMAYVNQSMSVRAANAYEHGERPISRWSKRAILDAAMTEGFDADEVKRLAAYPLPALRRYT
jgi:hypothetical protein